MFLLILYIFTISSMFAVRSEAFKIIFREMKDEERTVNMEGMVDSDIIQGSSVEGPETRKDTNIY